MLRFPVDFAHDTFHFNQHLDSAGALVAPAPTTNVVLDAAKWIPSYRDLREPLHLARGGTLGRVHEGLLGLRLRGRIEVPDASQMASLEDKRREMRNAFDPYECYVDSPTTDGAYALDYQSGTTDTGTYATGRIPLRRYMRPIDQPSFGEENLVDRSQPFELILVAADPREYEQTEQTLVLTPGSPSGGLLNRGTTPAPLKATIVMSGAGSATFSVGRGAIGNPVVLNLSGMVNLDTIVVYMETSGPYGRGRRITKNGVDNFALKTSDVASWQVVVPGTPSFQITNTTNVTSVTLAWYSARA